jgi:hypothetical protein
MTRDENRVDYVDEGAHPPQVDMIDPSNAADRDPDGVHRDWVIAAHFQQKLGCVRIGEKVFRVNLEPRHGRTGGHDLREVRQPEAHAGAIRHPPIRRHGHGHPLPVIKPWESCCR